MPEPMIVRGIGAVGAFGAGRAQLEEALSRLPGPNGQVEIDGARGRVVRPAYLADLSMAEKTFGFAALRRVDRFSQLAALGAQLALDDSGLAELDRRRVGLILATGYGSCTTTFRFHADCLDDGPALASPLLFSSSGHSAALANTSILLGISGPVLTVCQTELAVVNALINARQWLLERRVDLVLVGAQDEISGPRSYVLEELFGAANDGPLSPFDIDRQTAVTGEACAFLALSLDGDGAVMGELASGSLDAGPPQFPRDAVLILAADGHRSCGRHYRRAVPPETPVAAYAPLFGSLPTGLAMQLLVAVVARRRSVLPASPSVEGSAFSATVGTELDLSGRPLVCLECRRDGSYATVSLPAP